ncbi:MAG: FliI/YscN family ATPase [Spirochaetales bacterium]|nr:FliI/YscN family ATPase [Spirochaetales bacterium]
MIEKYLESVGMTEPIKYEGKVSKVQGVLIESIGPQAMVGELCHIHVDNTGMDIAAEVVSLKEDRVQLMVYGEKTGIEVGCKVRATGQLLSVKVGPELLGRVINALGEPVDGKGPIRSERKYPINATPPDPMTRPMIHDQIETGIRVIDSLISVGKGQRMGIFAGSGVGKSTTLGMIARNTSADINVIALIGERGREVREFLVNDLGEEGLKRSVIVVSTSDSPALSRIQGAFAATAIAEYFRDQGQDVMLLFDSVTRFAMAQREVGLAIGEPPSTRSYPPSVFTMLPKLLERTGTSEKGTITGFYTILVEGDDMDEPIADAVRGILDGHIVLSRTLANRYHYPAVDVLSSVSRLTTKILSPKILENIGTIRHLMAVYHEKEDLISLGAYVRGSSPEVDLAIEKNGEINDFLKQGITEKTPLKEVFRLLGTIAGNPMTDEELENEVLSILA